MLANTKEQDYYSSLSYIKKIIGITSSITFDSLASKFGCPRIIPYVESMLEIFKEGWCEDLSAAGKRGVNWNDDIYKVAAFWCCCKIVGVINFILFSSFFSSFFFILLIHLSLAINLKGQGKVNQEELISSPDFSTSHLEFQRTTKLVEKYCNVYIKELKSKIKKGEINVAFVKSQPSKRKNIDDKIDRVSKVRKISKKGEASDDESPKITETNEDIISGIGVNNFLFLNNDCFIIFGRWFFPLIKLLLCCC